MFVSWRERATIAEDKFVTEEVGHVIRRKRDGIFPMERKRKERRIAGW